MTGVQTLPQTKYMDVAWSPGETMLSELDRGEERGFEIVLGSGEGGECYSIFSRFLA